MEQKLHLNEDGAFFLVGLVLVLVEPFGAFAAFGGFVIVLVQLMWRESNTL